MITNGSIIKAGGLLSLVFVLVSIFFVTSTHAQSGGAQGIQLSPAIIELNAEAGKTYTLTVGVTNVTTSDLEYSVDVNDFAAKDESGSPEVLYDSKLPPQISVRTWVSSIPKFNLDTKKRTKVNFSLSVPADAEPGGHYGVLRFSGVEPKVKGSGVGLTASAGTLLLVKVAGDIKEQANVASFYTTDGTDQTNFFETAPVNFETRVENTGSIHIKPFGNIEVTNIFGAVVASIPVNKSKSNVLPSSIRRFDDKFGDYMIGPYTATVTLGYGTKGQAAIASTTFWVIPYKILSAAFLVLLLALFIFKRSMKAYNKRVIKKYKKHETKKDKR